MENGTHGRKWHTHQKNNIAFTLIIHTNCSVQALEGITIQIAETMVEVIQKIYGILLEIKFPNDIVYQGKKIGGILTQTKLKGEIAKYMMVGIGINCMQQEFPIEIETVATSIKKEFGLEVDRIKIMSEFCNLLENRILARLNERKEK